MATGKGQLPKNAWFLAEGASFQLLKSPSSSSQSSRRAEDKREGRGGGWRVEGELAAARAGDETLPRKQEVCRSSPRGKGPAG